MAGLATHRRWLSRGQLGCLQPDKEPLNRALAVIDHAAVVQGAAALRLWGQTGDRPDIWMAAADPVYLEPMLDHLRMHALRDEELPMQHLRGVIDDLQDTLGSDGRYSFLGVGQYGYLRGSDPIATASQSARVADGRKPDELMPQGIDAIAHDKLQAELQMKLHEHPVNVERETSAMRPINSLWFWGGGTAPQQETRQIPPYFGDDPLFRGYWNSCAGDTNPWPGSFAQCLEIAGGGFVAVAPDVPDEFAGQALCVTLTELRSMLRSGRLAKLSLIFHDGLEASLKRLDGLKFWRRVSPLLEGAR